MAHVFHTLNFLYAIALKGIRYWLPGIIIFLLHLCICTHSEVKAQAFSDYPYVQNSVTPAAQAEVDSLKRLLKTTPLDKEKIKLYGQLSYSCASTLGDVPLAHAYADSAKSLATALQNKEGLAFSNYYFGVVARHECNYTQALELLNKHILYCKAKGDSFALAQSLFQSAVVNQYLGNYETSLTLCYKAVELFQQNNYSVGIAFTFMSIGNLFVRMNKYDEAVEMYYKTIFILDSTRNNVLSVKINKQRALLNLGNAYAKLKQFDKARNCYKQSFQISYALGSNRTTATTLSLIGDVFNALGQYDSALQYARHSLMIREGTAQKEKIILSLIQVGETYIYLQHYSMANHHLMRALSLAKQANVKPWIRDTYEKLFMLYSKQRNFQQALAYHQLYAALKDSVLNEDIAQRFNELKAKYEAKEKDERIAVLAKEKEFQEKEVQRQANEKKISWGAFILMVILSALITHLLYQRMKNQKLLALKNEVIKDATFKQQLCELEMKALRAQINPHFLFNCLNSINRMILNEEVKTASLYLSKFSKLMRAILENAETTRISLENELAFLESYIHLEELRFKGKISYQIIVDKKIEAESTYLPTMILQPFVENAIWHGLMHKQKEEKGIITIGIKENEDMLLCTIEDNGVGREKAQLLSDQSLLKHKSMGMKITEERLRLLTPNCLEKLIRITDLKNYCNQAIGTRVEISIPTL